MRIFQIHFRFIIATLLILGLVLSLQNSCEDGSTNGPMENGQPTGAYNTSPEDSVVRELITEYEDEYNIELEATLFEGDIHGFLEILNNIFETFGHLDFIGFYSDDLDTLITQNWLKPYPDQIKVDDFLPEAIEGMTQNDTLYGVPIYINEDGRVKGAGVSARRDEFYELYMVWLIEYLTAPENSLQIAESADATPARKALLPDLMPVPNSVGSFCNRAEGNLIVTIKNQGVSMSPASRTEVNFFSHGDTTLRTPGLQPEESVELHFPIPDGCFDSNCEFQITVDVMDDVHEVNEENNTAAGNCIG